MKIEEILNKVYTSDLLSSEELHELTEWVCNKDKEIEDIRSKWYDDSEKYLLEIERLKEILDLIHEEIKYLYRKPKRLWYDDIQTLKTINVIVEKEIKGVDKE